MARAIDADELEMFPYSEGAGTEEQISEWIEQVGLSEDDTASRARDLCWKVIEGFINVVKTQPTLTPPNEPLTQADLDGMDYDKVWIDYEDGTGEWALVCKGYIYSIDTLEGAGLDFVDYMRGEKLEPHGYKVYRRPPEGGDGPASE